MPTSTSMTRAGLALANADPPSDLRPAAGGGGFNDAPCLRSYGTSIKKCVAHHQQWLARPLFFVLLHMQLQRALPSASSLPLPGPHLLTRLRVL
jgi:hypothetical protein